MMHVLLFAGYAAGLSWIVARARFLRNSGLPAPLLVAIFLISAAVGIVHLQIAYRYFPHHGDVWEVFDYSVRLRSLIQSDYAAFHKEFFPDPFSVDIIGTHLGWSYYQSQALAVIHLALDYLSFNNNYINTLLFNFMALFGKVAFYRALVLRYPASRVSAIIVAALLPSLLFWTAVIYKEGLLFAAVGVLIYCVQRSLDGRLRLRYIVSMAAVLFIIFVTRKDFLAVVLPALAVWWLAEKRPVPPLAAVAIVWGLTAAALIAVGLLRSDWSIAHALSVRQSDYLALQGHSQLYVPRVDGSWRNLVAALPYALRNALFMPLPGYGGQSMYLAFFVETASIVCLLIWQVAHRRVTVDPFTAAWFVAALVACIVVGITVPYAGAIVRYRSIMYPLLMLPFFQPLRGRIKKNIM